VIHGGEKDNIKKNNKLQAEMTPTFLSNTLLNWQIGWPLF